MIHFQIQLHKESQLKYYNISVNLNLEDQIPYINSYRNNIYSSLYSFQL